MMMMISFTRLLDCRHGDVKRESVVTRLLTVSANAKRSRGESLGQYLQHGWDRQRPIQGRFRFSRLVGRLNNNKGIIFQTTTMILGDFIFRKRFASFCTMPDWRCTIVKATMSFVDGTMTHGCHACRLERALGVFAL